MFKRTAVVLSLIILSLLPLIAITTIAAPSQTTPDAPVNTPSAKPPTGAGIAIARNNSAIINTHNLMVMGPEICTAWGDPFSPISPTWAATSWLDPLDFTGIYTYQFRIRIPADYPDDVVRVELLDPDSMNQAENETVIIHSRTAQLSNPILFPPTPVEKRCTSNQKSSCAIATGEETLVSDNGITVDHINPLWFMRMDENRGNGTYQCANFSEYTPETNTQTRFTLSYYNDNAQQVILGEYDGQVGDNVRDNGDHDTDLRWVSPGSYQSFDQATFVPSDQGSFTVNLAQNASDILVDPLTGEKLLYLDITALSGGSENGFSIWAGPDDYISSVPSLVNPRNLYVLSNPDAHDSQGVKVEAINTLPQNSLTSARRDYSLVELGPEYAGQTITVTLFDPDAGAKPPVMYFMDTLAFTPDSSAWDGIDHALTDWGVSFGGNDDPAFGCFRGGNSYGSQCNDQWVDPVYTITLPSDQYCDYANPTMETCTPFYGGELQTRYQSGMGDSFALHVSVPERPLLDNTQGCTAFPLAIDEGIRSVLPPGETGANMWRTDFDYPIPIPNYYSFVNHIPNVPLISAQEGYIYNIQNGGSAGGKGWLAWNQCMSDSNALVNSLTWPGNSKDYSPQPGTCFVNGEQTVKFAGFMELGDNSDKSMHVGDWVGISTGNVSSSAILDTLEGHIDLDRVLRVVVYDDVTGGGSSTAYRMSRFALMRLLGFSMDLGGGESFIMAEFIRWDDSCGQSPVFVNDISLTGPTEGIPETSYTFSSALSPINMTPPITITWSATDAAAVTQTNKLEASQAFQWSSSGVKTITVTAQNSGSAPFTATHQITITAPMDLIIGPLDLVTTPPITAMQSVMFRTTITNTGDFDLSNQFFIDVFINPTDIGDESILLDQSSGYTAVSSLAANTSKVVTITAPFGFPPHVTTHTVYAMVDSLNGIIEHNERNNISEPLTVTNILPPPPRITVTPTCSSTPTATLTVNGYYWPTDEDVALYFDGNLRTLITEHDGSFNTAWLEQSISVGQDYEITAVSPSHTVSATLTTPCQPAGPGYVTISGPTVGRIGEPLTFVATIDSITAVLPLTYTWWLPDRSQIIHSNGLTDTFTLTENILGSHGLAVHVENGYGQSYGRYSFEIVEQQIFLPIIMKPEE